MVSCGTDGRPSASHTIHAVFKTHKIKLTHSAVQKQSYTISPSLLFEILKLLSAIKLPREFDVPSNTASNAH